MSLIFLSISKMPSQNKVILASAGAGKTTTIVRGALAALPKRTAIVTFTVNNAEAIKTKFYEENGSIPKEVVIYTWYTFALQELVRPYQSALCKRRVSSVKLANGASTKGIAKTNVEKYYLNKSAEIYSDKLSDFSLTCNQKTKGLVVKRLEDMFDRICVDEVQDFAGYDIDILEMFLCSKINVTLVGDIRQATFRTNYASKNRKFVGLGFVDKIRKWVSSNLCDVEYLNVSYRCHQKICDLADSIFPSLPRAISHNRDTTDHDGLFLIKKSDVSVYIERYRPQVLRYSRATACDYPAMNFGEAKGLGYPCILILPYGKMQKWLKTGDISHVLGSAEKVYVAITRARQSVAIQFDDVCKVEGLNVWEP